MILDATLVAMSRGRLDDAEWREAAAARAKAAAEQRCTDGDEAIDAVLAAEVALYRTPAPTIAAIIEKLRLNYLAQHGVMNGGIEEAIASSLEDGTLNEEVPALAYRDSQRLGGVFDPAEWLTAMRRAGGSAVVAERDGRAVLDVGEVGPLASVRQRAQHRALVCHLNADPANAVAVLDYLRPTTH